MKNIPVYIESKRSSYVQLSVVVKGFIITIAFIIGFVGLLLFFTPPPFFDLGVVLLLLSLSVLSFQFKWAHGLLVYITKKLSDKTFRKNLFIFIGVLSLLVIGFILYRFFV